jgi:hypothetical protein
VLDTTTKAGERAERRLREEEIAWLTTVRREGQPQAGTAWSLDARSDSTFESLGAG